MLWRCKAMTRGPVSACGACSPARRRCSDAACLGARQPVNAEQVAISGLHSVLLQCIALRAHERCMRHQAHAMHAGHAGRCMAALAAPRCSRKGAPAMVGYTRSFSGGNVLRQAVRRAALSSSTAAAASSACGIWAAVLSEHLARSCSLAALGSARDTS